jgi:3-(3-hydroxy-phenyl)propionate hydroxylase
VLIDLGAPGGIGIAPWADRVRSVEATHAGPWELPLIGEVAAPTAVLVRPDGYVAWVGVAADPVDPDDPARPGLAEALATWFGPPAPSA